MDVPGSAGTQGGGIPYSEGDRVVGEGFVRVRLGGQEGGGLQLGCNVNKKIKYEGKK